MARRAIREYDAKRIFYQMMPKYGADKYYIQADPVQVRPETDLSKLPDEHPWLDNKRVVVKPDQLFGKRGKSGLVLLDASFKEASKFISQKMGKQAKVGKVSGTLTHFIIDEFVPHKIEYYAAIKMDADGDHILFSTKGGMNIEEVWDTVNEVVIDPLGDQGLNTETLLKGIPPEEKKVVGPFIKGMYQYFSNCDLTLLELNPFSIVDGKIRVLDMRTMLDDTAAFQNAGIWDDVEFPSPFGREPTKEEAFIKSLDEKTGASLKLTILNPEGRVWTMVAGGGASVVYADTIVDKGFGKELANYGEYSGDPSTEETYLYARTVLSLLTKEKHKSGKDKILIIGGGIANFTDVANTFTGIIQALKEYSEKMKQVGVRIYVRRGGPNYKAGLDKMRAVGKELDLKIKVFGPEAHMTHIIPMALEEDEKGVN